MDGAWFTLLSLLQVFPESQLWAAPHNLLKQEMMFLSVMMNKCAKKYRLDNCFLICHYFTEFKKRCNPNHKEILVDWQRFHCTYTFSPDINFLHETCTCTCISTHLSVLCMLQNKLQQGYLQHAWFIIAHRLSQLIRHNMICQTTRLFQLIYLFIHLFNYLFIYFHVNNTQLNM